MEALAPARAHVHSIKRWTRHIGLALLGNVASRLALGGGLVSVALLAKTHGFGLFNWLDTPTWLAVLVCVVVLDFAIWAQHLAMHQMPFLWRLHRVHHGDTEMDVTTALRFHPFEIWYLWGSKSFWWFFWVRRHWLSLCLKSSWVWGRSPHMPMSNCLHD
ncbi:MAG: hypothetical protein HC777_00130 [Hyphomonadaceae bacterium]|nr:hypothetical protein [Hyphomonadaceae bacterium]